MTTMLRCPRCQKPIDASQTEGLCAECLMRQVVQGESQLNDERGVPATAPIDASSSGFVPPTPLELAECFPQLEVFQLIGQGGMGAVYRARQKSLDRIVALKILPPNLSSDPTFAERFTREAQAMARLHHPNIVTSFEVGQQGPYYFLLMEYVDGVNLREAIRDGRIESRQALSVVSQICDALQYAHDEGIVHRDIKPENILVDTRGRVKIADFGLAKMLRRTPVQLTLTGTNQVMGTLHYMAPEQVEHPLEVDHRADIFSLGVVFYEMMTGHLPLGRFELPSEKGSFDPRLDEVVLKALQREPARRYQYADEVKTDVSRITDQPAKPNVDVTGKSTLHARAGGGEVSPDEELRHHQLLSVIQPVARTLMWVGYGGAVLIASSPLLFKWLSSSAADGSFRYNLPLIVILVLAVPGVLQAVFIGNAGVALKSLRGYHRTLALLVLSALPFSFFFVFGLPVVIWAIHLMTRPGAKDVFQVGDRLATASSLAARRERQAANANPNLLAASMIFFGLLVAVIFALVIIAYAMARKDVTQENERERWFQEFKQQSSAAEANSSASDERIRSSAASSSTEAEAVESQVVSFKYDYVAITQNQTFNSVLKRQVERACLERIKYGFNRDNGSGELAELFDVSVDPSGVVLVTAPDLPGMEDLVARRVKNAGAARFYSIPSRGHEPPWSRMAHQPSVVELKLDGRVVAKWIDVHDSSVTIAKERIENERRFHRDADGSPQVLIWEQTDMLAEVRVGDAEVELADDGQNFQIALTPTTRFGNALKTNQVFGDDPATLDLALMLDERVLFCRIEIPDEGDQPDKGLRILVQGEFDKIEAEDIAAILESGPIFGRLVRNKS